MFTTSRESIKVLSSTLNGHKFSKMINLGNRQGLIHISKRFRGAPSKLDEDEYEENYSPFINEEEIQEGKEAMFPGIARSTDIIMSSGKGMYVTDVYGKTYFDFTSGIGALSTGHTHPKVIESVKNQLDKLVHAQVSVAYHDVMFKLFSKMKTVFPKSLDSYFLWNSGAEAVEASIKLAKHATKKPNIISFNGGYHGRTFGSMALTTSKTIYSTGFGPFPSGIYSTPYPYSSQMPKGISEKDMTDYCLDEVERLLQQKSAPSDTAAMIVETILGEGGYVVPPKDFLPRLKKICEKNGILLILDEVQTGFGRTGKMFAFEHFGVIPDIVVMAKGFGSGFPISGIATRKELSSTQPAGSMGGTYAGNPMVCAAALATLEVFEEEKLIENARERGEQFHRGLKEITKGLPIKEVRGLGLMQAFEFDKSVPKGTATNFTKQVLKEENMIILSTSIYETVRFVPSLIVSEHQIDLSLEKMQRVLKKMF